MHDGKVLKMISSPVLTRRSALGLVAAAWTLAGHAFGIGDLIPAKGSGRVVTQTPELPAFTGVEVSDALAVEIEQGQPPQVRLEGDDNLLALLDLQVHGAVLRLRQQRPFRPTRLRIVITVWQFDSIVVTGSAAVRAGTLVAKELQLRGGGSGVVSLAALTAERVVLNAGGSSVIKLAGQANELQAALGGSAVVEASALQVRRVQVHAGGSAVAKVWARDTLDGGVSGSAGLRYKGEPQLTVSKTGAGRVRAL